MQYRIFSFIKQRSFSHVSATHIFQKIKIEKTNIREQTEIMSKQRKYKSEIQKIKNKYDNSSK